MSNPDPRPDIEAVLKDPDNHFMDWRRLDDGTYIAIGRLAFTVGLFIGVGPITPYKRRYCFADLRTATDEYLRMQTGADLPSGWIARRPELPEDIEAKSKPNYNAADFWPKREEQ